MSDFDALANAEQQLKSINTNARWLGFGIFSTVLLIMFAGWVLLLMKAPLIVGSISLLLVLPFVIGLLFKAYYHLKVANLRKRTTQKDDAVEI